MKFNTVESDIETIRGIEEQISKLEDELATTGSADTEDAADEDTPFKDLSGTDFDGNKVDGTLFSNNAVTVLNFWFTGCKPCVAELSKLNEMNEAIKSMGGEVSGMGQKSRTPRGLKQSSSRCDAPPMQNARPKNAIEGKIPRIIKYSRK